MKRSFQVRPFAKSGWGNGILCLQKESLPSLLIRFLYTNAGPVSAWHHRLAGQIYEPGGQENEVQRPDT